jgi:hypothetical protein
MFQTHSNLEFLKGMFYSKLMFYSNVKWLGLDINNSVMHKN